MNTRSLIVSSVMLSIFVVFLFWLHSVGKISVLGICALIVSGILFVGLSHYFYKKFWSDLD